LIIRALIKEIPALFLKVLIEKKNTQKRRRGKMKNQNHTFSCYQYCNRVYDLIQKLEQIEDKRVHPSVKLPTVILTNLFSLMSGLHSFKEMKDAIKDGDFDNFFKGVNLPSADTISYTLKHKW